MEKKITCRPTSLKQLHYCTRNAEYFIFVTFIQFIAFLAYYHLLHNMCKASKAWDMWTE